jgi:hypothetical protein
VSLAVKWKIWYDDGTTFSSDDGNAENAPVDGILAILEKRSDNTVMNHHGNDYYYWTGEVWMSGGQASMERWMRRELPALKFGRWADDTIWREVIEESVAWQ